MTPKQKKLVTIRHYVSKIFRNSFCFLRAGDILLFFCSFLGKRTKPKGSDYDWMALSARILYLANAAPAKYGRILHRSHSPTAEPSRSNLRHAHFKPVATFTIIL